MEQVIDPEIGLDVVNLGLVYDVYINEESESVAVELTLTSPGCPLGEEITRDAERVLLALPGVRRADVSIVWDPPWHPDRVTPLGRARLGLGG